VDGNIQKLKGNIPAKFEFEAFRIELAFAPVVSKSENYIAVKTSADGRALPTGFKSETGIHLQLNSFGYSENFGGTLVNWGRMTPEEVDRLIKDQAMPQGIREL